MSLWEELPRNPNRIDRSKKRRVDLVPSFVLAFKLALAREKENKRVNPEAFEAARFDQRTIRNCAKRELHRSDLARFEKGIK